VLMTKIDIMGKSECLVSQTRTSGFYSYEMVNISQTIQACFSGYARVSWTIWLNFTQETKKFLKLQEDELKLKI
jgi:hypothetical protein